MWGERGGESNSKIFFESLPKISNDRLLHYCSVGVVGIDRSSGVERERGRALRKLHLSLSSSGSFYRTEGIDGDIFTFVLHITSCQDVFF